MERKHCESPPRRRSQPRGVRAHRAPLEAGNRCGAGTGRIADHSVSDHRSSNLACKMRPRHAARVTRPSGRDTDGHPAETPTGESAAVSTTIKGQRKKKSRQKRDKQRQKVKYRTGREGGTLVYSPRLVLVDDPGPRSLGRERNRQTRTFWHRYVSVHSDTTMFS